MIPETSDLVTSSETDETAWLERTAELVRLGRFDQVHTSALAEYLADMAGRGRREVFSRLVVLLAHLLKWEHQPERRSGSWLGTILDRQLLESGTLRNHALEVFAAAYSDARKQAAAEMSLPRSEFPGGCPWDLDGALVDRGEDIEA